MRIDLLEPVENFVVRMNDELSVLKQKGKIGKILQISMQNWVPEEPQKYTLLWCQWCCGHLTDQDFLKWMDNCRIALKNGGVLIDQTVCFEFADATVALSCSHLLS